MAELKKKTRMIEPWGYRDENNYQGMGIILENDLDSFFADVSYSRDDNMIHFSNKDGEEKATLDVSEFIKSDSIVERAWYEDGKIYVKFTNGDVITIDVEELIDQNEFADGLQVNDGVVSVLIDGDSEYFLTVSQNGVKVSGVQDAINVERDRAQAEEARIEGKLDDEIARATSAETALDEKIDQEIADRTADVNAEEDRATTAEEALQTALSNEITRATQTEQQLNSRIDTTNGELEHEESRALAAEQELSTRLTTEVQDRIAAVNAEEARATSAETELQAAIEDEGQRAQDAETALDEKIDQEVLDRKAEAVASAEYVKDDVKIYLKNDNGETLSEIDCNDFIVDSMIDNVEVVTSGDTSVLVITWNTAGGSKVTTIDIGDIFEADNYYTKDEVDAIENSLQGSIDTEEARAKAEEVKKVDRQVNGTNGKALIFNETDGGGAKFENTDGINSFVGVNDAGAGGIDAQIYAINKDTKEGSRIDVSNTGVYYTVGSDAPTSRMVEDNEIATKGNVNDAVSGKADAETVYTKEDVDALLLAKENEIYNLTKIVGDMGGAVTYNLPNEAGKPFNTLMSNNGTVKLTDDVTTGRFGPGVIANNKVKLNLNTHDLIVTGLTTSSAQPAIMARGTQEITIYGKGTIDAGNGICVEGNGADSVINLTGSTTVYQTDRSGGELIYCYAGTINITNGTFKNNGEDKKFLLNCYDANYRNGTAKIIVTGGKFYDFNPADNSAEGEHTSFVPSGYHVETSIDGESTVYTVKKDA